MPSQSEKILVVGAGAWGTALAARFALNGHAVMLYGRDQAVADQINHSHTTPYLPEVTLPDHITATTALDINLDHIRYVVVAVPSKAFDRVCQDLNAYLSLAEQSVAWATKGIDPVTNQLFSDLLKDTYHCKHVALISGPSFALEVAQQKPTAINLVSEDEVFQRQLFADLNAPQFRVYQSDDLIGSQVCAIYKNVIAIACGICDGMDIGFNGRAALLTRGLEEMRRLVLAVGGEEKTVYGLCGLGDMLLTATGDLSRNRQFGLAIAKYRSIVAAAEATSKTIEGQANIHWLLDQAQKYHVELPICAMVAKILNEELSVEVALELLLERRPDQSVAP